jgi:diaminohydroxyphosphoribosylaminopyrimidine deaminase/5-amino-6-(5-phosphoribosylamino)uracil reductase
MRSGVRRVVAAMQDPDPRVDGRGFAELRRGNVAVEVGVLGEESRRLNEPFIRWHRQRLPLVTLKAAISQDGMLSADRGVSQWITGATARRFAHRLRLRHDALLVGAGTVRRDDPRLTVRLPGIGVTRRRVVLSTSLELDPASKVFDEDQPGSPRTRVYTSSPDTSRPQALLERGEVVRVAERDGGADLSAALADLARCGVQSVLVEGGGRTFGRFLDSGLAQRMALFVSGKLLGGRGGVPLIDRVTVARPDLGWRFEREELIPLGEDLLLWGRLLACGDRPDRGGSTCSPD